jgi:16S rRNA (uracil1498-N3)-methyltransferase
LNLFYHPTDLSGQLKLTAEEVRHATKVLRHQVGDHITITDGKGQLAEAVIKQLAKDQCVCQILQRSFLPKPGFSIHLAIAPTKNSDRMEWLVEKCTELGVDQISFIHCRHSERKSVNLERLEKVAISAMKQSQQAWLPTLEESVPFSKVLLSEARQRFIAHVDATNPRHLIHVAANGKTSLVLIGPEGDFSEDELNQALISGFEKVSLGPHRLRTETAGLVATTTLHLINA